MPGQLTRQQLTVLILGLMATGIGQSLVFALLAPLGREVALSEVATTSIIAVSALTFGLAAPYWGRFSDRVGRKRVIITGLIGYTVGTLLFASVFQAALSGLLTGTTFYVIIMLTRSAQSAVMSATNPASRAYGADHSSPDERTRTMARLATASSLGTILGPAVSGALAVFGLLAPLYFAAVLAALAALCVWRYLPVTPQSQRQERRPLARLRYTDQRLMPFMVTAIGVYIGFSGIQQTLGFHLQDKLGLTGIETAQMTGAALMVSASFSLVTQVTFMQRANLGPTQFIRLGLLFLLTGAGIVTVFETFAVLAVGMAFIGTGMAMTMPAIASGASLAVSAEEQGGAAGLVSACPPLGFAVGPVAAGALYQVNPVLSPLFSGCVFLLVLCALLVSRR